MYLLPEDGKGKDVSGHGKKLIEQGALTNWRRQREGLVRARKEKDRARGTHRLEVAEGRTCQDTERNRPSKAHSLSGDGRQRDLSGHGKKKTDRGALTNWRRHRARLVRTRNETDRQRQTHCLETAEGEACQDAERNRQRKAHSPTGGGRGRDLSGHEKKPTEQGPLTPWRRQREGLVRTRKETNRARGTHRLETAQRWTCQDMERNRPSKAHSLSGDGRGRDLSGHEKKPTEQGTLTVWRRQREGLVRTRNKNDRARCTHFLETAEAEPCQDMEGNRQSKAHSLSGDGRGRDLSGHGKKPTGRGTLTNWRR